MKSTLTYTFLAAYVLWTLVSCSAFTATKDPITGIRMDAPAEWQDTPNPLDSPRPRSLEPVRVRMELEGYDTIERMIVFDSDARLEITLVPTAGRPQGGTTGASTTSSMRIGADPTPPPSGTMMEASSTPMDGFRDTFD